MNIKEQCLNIYKEAFEECIPFEQRLFSEAFEYCRYITEEDRVVSMLFAIPCFIQTEISKHKAVYIFAAATSPEHRNKGYMKKLLENVKSETDSILFLRPATSSLIEYYKKTGFKEISAINSSDFFPKVTPSKVMESISQGCIFGSGEIFTIMMYPFDEKIQNLGFVYSME